MPAGRPPDSVAVKRSKGDSGKKGARKHAESLNSVVAGDRGLPCPANLKGGLAREQWRIWAQQLAVMGQDRVADAPLLAAACMHYQTLIEANNHIQEFGAIIDQPILSRDTGEIVGHKQARNLWVPIRSDASKNLASICSRFGFNPADITRIKADKKASTESDLMAALMSEPEPAPKQVH